MRSERLVTVTINNEAASWLSLCEIFQYISKKYSKSFLYIWSKISRNICVYFGKYSEMFVHISKMFVHISEMFVDISEMIMCI